MCVAKPGMQGVTKPHDVCGTFMNDCPIDITVVDGTWHSVNRGVDLMNILAFFNEVEYVGSIHVIFWTSLCPFVEVEQGVNFLSSFVCFAEVQGSLLSNMSAELFDGSDEVGVGGMLVNEVLMGK